MDEARFELTPAFCEMLETINFPDACIDTSGLLYCLTLPLVPYILLATSPRPILGD